MARAFTKNTANYMSLGIGALAPLLNSAAAISISALINGTSYSTGANDNGIVTALISSNIIGLQLNISSNPSKVRCGGRSTSSDGLQTSNGATTITTGAHHVGGVLNVSGDTIMTYLDGAQDSSTAVTFANTTWTNEIPSDDDSIGTRGATPPVATSSQFDGSIAELAIWIAAIGTPNFAALAKGVSPRVILPTALVAYWPLIGYASPEIDLFGGKNGTITGTVAKAVHPRVIYPDPRIFLRAAAAAAGDAVPQVWGQYRRRFAG
ncbi:MAG: LamG-like jellyroll fold domain-containing protein [Tepidisphaeraceae bacterium]